MTTRQQTIDFRRAELAAALRRRGASQAMHAVAEWLVLEGEPGDEPWLRECEISDRDLAELLGISRTSIRRAARMLAACGVATRRGIVCDMQIRSWLWVVDLSALQAWLAVATPGEARRPPVTPGDPRRGAVTPGDPRRGAVRPPETWEKQGSEEIVEDRHAVCDSIRIDTKRIKNSSDRIDAREEERGTSCAVATRADCEQSGSRSLAAVMQETSRLLQSRRKAAEPDSRRSTQPLVPQVPPPAATHAVPDDATPVSVITDARLLAQYDSLHAWHQWQSSRVDRLASPDDWQRVVAVACKARKLGRGGGVGLFVHVLRSGQPVESEWLAQADRVISRRDFAQPYTGR